MQYLEILRILFDSEKEGESYYKPVRVNNSRRKNFIEYKSSSGINKILSVEEYLNKTRPYLEKIINNL